MRSEEAPRDGSALVAPSAEDRRTHLEFIQAVVTRMAASSASTKGWLLPVVTATFGYALTKQQAPIALLGTAAVIVFAVLDANYLNQERAFRRLYDAVAAGKNVEPFSMNPSLAAPATGKPVEAGKWWREVWAAIRGWIPPATVWSSWAIAPFYGSFVLLGLLIVTFAL